MNRVDLVGRLTRDPELRHTTTGRAVCQINLAINKPFSSQNGERDADFINVVVWDKQAENVSKYLSKGRLVAVEGRIQTRNYENNEGKRVYVTEVVASNVQFLESKGSQNAVSNQDFNPFDNNMTEDFSNKENKDVVTVDVDNDPFENFGQSVDLSDDDLPF